MMVNEFKVLLRDPHRSRAARIKGSDYKNLHGIYPLNALNIEGLGAVFKKIKVKVPYVEFPDGKLRTVRFKVNKERTEIRIEVKQMPTIFLVKGQSLKMSEIWRVDLDNDRYGWHDSPYEAYLHGLVEVWDFKLNQIS